MTTCLSSAPVAGREEDEVFADDWRRDDGGRLVDRIVPEELAARGIGSPLMATGAPSTSETNLTCLSPTLESAGTASLPGSSGGSGGSTSGGSGVSQSAPAAASGSGGLSVVLFDSAQPSRTGLGNAPGSTGSNTLTLEEGVPPPRLTPLVFHPGSDEGPGFVSTVWTGDEGGVQFVLAAEQEKNQASQPLPIGKPGQLVFIVSGAQPGSQVPYRGTTATTTPVDGGSLVPPSGGASYSVFSAVGGLLNVIGGACQAAVGVNVVIAASAATVATEGGASPLTVPIAIGGSVVVVHGLDQVWAGVTTIYTGQTQRPYTAQALDPLTGNETASDIANAGVGIVFSLGAGAYANGAQIAGQVANKGDEIASAVGAVAGRSDDAVGVVDDVVIEIAPIQFGRNANQGNHAIRHVENIVDVAELQKVISKDLEAVRNALAQGLNKRSVFVGRVEFRYHAFLMPDGTVNVGRITPVLK